MFKIIFLKIIRLYQKTLSPDHGIFSSRFKNGFCRFYPTCSQYNYDAIEKYGVVKGVPRGVWRILRCNPWSRGGYDPVK